MACGLLETLKFSVLELQEHLDTYNTKREAAEQVSLLHTQIICVGTLQMSIWTQFTLDRRAALPLAFWWVLGQLFFLCPKDSCLWLLERSLRAQWETAAVGSVAGGVRSGVWSDRCGQEHLQSLRELIFCHGGRRGEGDGGRGTHNKLAVEYRCSLLRNGSAVLVGHLNTGPVP